MSYSTAEVWLVILLLGIGTFLIRFSFLGLIGDRKLPEWALRHLRYTPVAVLPGLVAPLVLWPAAADGNPDPARLTAAAVTVVVAWVTKNVLWGAGAGAVSFAVILMLI